MFKLKASALCARTCSPTTAKSCTKSADRWSARIAAASGFRLINSAIAASSLAISATSTLRRRRRSSGGLPSASRARSSARPPTPVASPNHALVYIQPIDSALPQELRVVRGVLAETQYRIGKILRRADFGQRLIELVLDNVKRLFLVGQNQKALPAKNEVESDGGDRVRLAGPGGPSAAMKRASRCLIAESIFLCSSTSGSGESKRAAQVPARRPIPCDVGPDRYGVFK